MTRFARAKGSKSSNEKLPEEGTPWAEMKNGLLITQQKGAKESSTISSKTHEIKEVKPLEWFNLDDEMDNCLNILKKHLKKNVINDKTENNKQENIMESRKKSKTKGKQKFLKAEVSLSPQKKNKKIENFTVLSEGLNNLDNKSNEVKTIDNTKDEAKPECNVLGKLERKKRKNNELLEKCISKDGSVVKKKKIATNEGENIHITPKSEDDILSNKKKPFGNGKRKQKKYAARTNAVVQDERKFKSDRNKFTTKVNIGGEMVTLMKYQGFYVTKDDAKRLKDIKRKMHEEGISENEIESVIKLERRKCEKSLARMKKNVCFQCRKPGHILSQCPEMRNNIDTGTGVCYKCGSTEHKAFTCKVSHGQKFPFAECFICKEKGHIARECPDNPRGLYPNGGCCKLCGDVTHLKKDCPTKISESEEKTVKLGLRDDRNLEGLEDIIEKQEPNNRSKREKKPITF